MAELNFTCKNEGVTISGGSGITVQEHELIDSLVHNLSENTHTNIIRNSKGQVSSIEILDSVGGTPIRTTSIIRNIMEEVIQVVENQHDSNGVVIQTLTTNIARSGGQVVSLGTVET